jgi:hypothetical protein
LRVIALDLQQQNLRQQKEEKMKPTSKTLTASAAIVFTFALLAMTAPAAYADDYCISNGAQAAHGCGYPTMEACRAASAGIGGVCGAALSPGNPRDALGYQPKQPHARRQLRARRVPTVN